LKQPREAGRFDAPHQALEVWQLDISSFKRFEIKYLIGRDEAVAFAGELALRMDLDGHCHDGEGYRISSIYFDTFDRELIRHSLSHPLYKEKLRMRAYGGPKQDDDLVFLEMKKKFDGVIGKRRATMTLRQAEDFVDTGLKPQLDGYMNNQVADEVSYFLRRHEVMPSAFIGYTRLAFSGSQDMGLRVTFDRDIVARRGEASLRRPSYGERIIRSDQVLMEVKFTSSVPLWLAGMLSDAGFYRQGFSKYGTEHEMALSRTARASAMLPRGTDSQGMPKSQGNIYVKDLRRSVSL
jgi:hypothetical protein